MKQKGEPIIDIKLAYKERLENLKGLKPARKPLNLAFFLKKKHILRSYNPLPFISTDIVVVNRKFK